jgi:hypothetical protein
VFGFKGAHFLRLQGLRVSRFSGPGLLRFWDVEHFEIVRLQGYWLLGFWGLGVLGFWCCKVLRI